MHFRSWRWRRTVAVSGLVLALGGGLAFWPSTTRQGINYEVSTHRLPLYRKAADFVERSSQYQELADQVVAGVTGDEPRARAVFDWTCATIRQVPDGAAVIDDHILNIVTRGYGTGDQQADVFATVTTYAGVDAFWARVPLDRTKPGVILSFARVNGTWRVFDVARGVAFQTADGRLATFAELQSTPSMVPAAIRDQPIDGRAYEEVLASATMPPIPRPLRAQLQMPLPRVWHEFKAVLGLTSQS